MNPDDFYDDIAVGEIIADMPIDSSVPSEEFFPTSSNTQPGYILVRNGKSWGAIDSLGKVVLPLTYSHEPISITKDLYALPDGNGKMNLINRSGKELLTAQRILFADNHGLIPYQQDGEWGFINRDGKHVFDVVELRKKNIALPRIKNDFPVLRGLVISKTITVLE